MAAFFYFITVAALCKKCLIINQMKILNKTTLADLQDTKIVQIEVSAPDISKKAMPGQFVVLMANERGERIPLTVVAKDVKKGSVTLILQELGLTTKLLGKLKTGDSLYALVGPLGHATEIKNYGKVILVGGGVGIAEIYPVARAFKEAGNHVTAILGARTKELLILENELKSVSSELRITTDDGSYGRKGFTTDVLRELLVHSPQSTDHRPQTTDHTLHPITYNLVYAVGPIPMMRKVAATTSEFGIKTVVSLNAIMVDGTGMCGCCRVTVANQTKFSCVDGPEFDAHLVDWDELIKRSKIYLKQEKHICQLENKV